MCRSNYSRISSNDSVNYAKVGKNLKKRINCVDFQYHFSKNMKPQGMVKFSSLEGRYEEALTFD